MNFLAIIGGAAGLLIVANVIVAVMCNCNPELVRKGYHRVECPLSGRKK